MAVFLVAAVGMSCPALAVSWKVTQVTDNDGYYDEYPQISGSNVVWAGEDETDYEYEIFFWDGDPTSEPINISNSIYDDWEPQISGSNVVWSRYEGGDDEIFFWPGDPTSEPINISNSIYDDWEPQISGSNVVWSRYEGGDDEIFFWPGDPTSEPINISNSIYDDRSPQISGSNVVWEGHDGNDYEIFFWDGTTITQVTSNSYSDSNPQISGSNVVWEGYDGNDYEIFFWAGTTITQVTNNSYDDYDPQISGSNVVWSGYDGNDYEIFFWAGTTITQITNNSYDDYDPQISGSNVVWEGEDDSSYNNEIFFWDGDPTSGPINISNNSSSDDGNPQISGSNVVWEGYDGDYEIFMAVPLPTIYVDVDATGANSGSSWADAYNHLQDALTAADPYDEIRVAEGTYKPDAKSSNPGGSGNRTATFQLINRVAIKGGYAGFGETDPDHRDIALYETILSGNINALGDSSDNSYHVVTGSGTESNATLDGFTITAGNANGVSPYNRGGGMYNDSGSPKLVNCNITNNSAGSNGGGMYIGSGNPTLVNCIFSGNGANMGGGLSTSASSLVTVVNCVFTANSGGNSGGAILSNGSLIVTNSVFYRNQVTPGMGGAISNWTDSTLTVQNSILWSNLPDQISVLAGSSAPVVTYSDVEGGYSGTGNIDEDPLFIGPDGLDGIPGTADDEEGYVHLWGYSPCINAGDPSGDYNGQVDVDNQPRVAYGRVDMGADEVYPAAGDFEPDGDVDFGDFAIFAENWLLGL